ncbi:MAG: hypothetical protein ABIP48_32140 [Planctomycetota bacterium]
MRIGFLSLCGTAVLALSVSLVGCGSDSGETPAGSPSSPPAASEADDDHGDHDHGDAAGHVHPTEGPHGGQLIELGNAEYHAELVDDEKTHTVTVHLLDAAGKEPVGIDQPEITLQLLHDGDFATYALKRAAGQTGAASAFEIVDAGLSEALSSEDGVQGRLQVTINGKQYSGDVKHAPHEGHDHGDDDHADHDHDGDDHDGEDHEH